MKIMLHNKCGGKINKKTLVCDRCKKKPRGPNIILKKLDKGKTQSVHRRGGILDTPEYYFSPHNRRNRTI